MAALACLRPLRGKGPTAYLIEPGPLETPCWVWQGCLNSKGYPVRGTQHGRYLVHRRVCELTFGPLAATDEVHHLCERHACVNPAHLEPLASLEHVRTHHGHATIAERAGALLAARGVMHTREIAVELGLREGSVGVSLRRAAQRGELVALGRALWAPIALEVAA